MSNLTKLQEAEFERLRRGGCAEDTLPRPNFPKPARFCRNSKAERTKKAQGDCMEANSSTVEEVWQPACGLGRMEPVALTPIHGKNNDNLAPQRVHH